MDPATLKTVAEVFGTVLTTLSVILMGSTGRVQRAGMVVSLLAVIPWTVFAVVTSSWTLLPQSAICGAATAINLYLSIKRSLHAA